MNRLEFGNCLYCKFYGAITDMLKMAHRTHDDVLYAIVMEKKDNTRLMELMYALRTIPDCTVISEKEFPIEIQINDDSYEKTISIIDINKKRFNLFNRYNYDLVFIYDYKQNNALAKSIFKRQLDKNGLWLYCSYDRDSLPEVKMVIDKVYNGKRKER